MKPNISEFSRFYNLLMSSASSSYIPHLFALEQKNKDPLSTRPWSAINSRLSFNEAVRFMEFGYNIGIAAMDDELVLVDVDDMNAIPESDIKPTLSVITRSRVGTHNYYFTEDKHCKINIPTSFGEVRSCNQYLVCPGSFVSTDVATVPKGHESQCGYYTIHNPVAPSSITFNEFPKVFRAHVEAIKNMPPRSPNPPTKFRSKSALFDITISDVVSYPKNKARFASVFHGSVSGSNTAISGNLLHCWRHLVSHTPLQALSVMAGLYTCQEAGETHTNGGSGHSMLDIRDGETMYKLWDYARRNGYIPSNDLPPSSAMTWFAVESGVCHKDEIKDGWQLTSRAYREARHLLRVNI